MLLSRTARARAALSSVAAQAVLKSDFLCRVAAAKRSASIDGRTLDRQLAAMLRLDDFGGNSRLRGLSPERARARLAEDVSVAQVLATGETDVESLTLDGVLARLYVPRVVRTPSPAVLFIHGGGFVTGDLDTHEPLCRLIATQARVRVVSIDYRLAPEQPFPAAAEDSVRSFRALVARASELGIDPTRVAVAGDSAGGNLSAVVALRTRGDALRPALQVPIYPALDATCGSKSHATFAEGFFLTRTNIDWYYDHYFGPDGQGREHPDGSPLWASSFSHLPPALIYTSGFDPLRDEGYSYAERLRADGVSVSYHCFDDMLHGFLLMTAMSRAALRATEQVAREIGEALHSGSV